MKILQINDYDLSRLGGGEVHIRQLLDLLRNKGHQVDLFAPQKSYSPVFRILNLFTALNIRELCKRKKYDLVHVHSVSRNISPLFLLFLPKKVRVVMTLHSFCYACPRGWGIHGKEKCLSRSGFFCFFTPCGRQRRIYNLFFIPYTFLLTVVHRRLIDARVHTFITPSLALKKATEKIFKGSQVVCLPHFYESGIKKSNLSSNLHQFLFVGRISEEKGWDVLLQAIKKSLKSCPEIQLKVAGEGPDSRRMKKKARTLGLDDHIHFLGKCSPQQLSRHYEESLALIVPSLWLEAFGLVNLEAMSHATPVIASCIGGIPEILENDKNAFLFEPGNAEALTECLIRMYENKELSEKMGKKGFLMLKEKFSVDDYYRKLIRIYAQ